MCRDCLRRAGKVGPPRRVLAKQDFSPEVERAYQWLLDQYRNQLDPIEADIEEYLAEASGDDLETLASIRSELESRFGAYTADFQEVFREGAERGAEAGRAVAARRLSLDIAFDQVPEETLSVLDDWSEVAADSTLETITEDSTRWLRGAHEEGLSIDDIRDQVQELYDDRLEDHVARRAARTATVSSSNTGNHSAHVSADGVIAERWLATGDDRTRDSHLAADGQVVAVDGSFEVGGVYAEYPGDPSLPVGELANCRCTVVGVFADDLTEDQIESIEAGERIWL